MMVAGSSRLQCFHSDALAGHFMLPPCPQPRSFTGASSGRVCVWLHCAFAVAHRLSVVAAGEGYSPVAVGELLLTAASAVAEHGLQGKWAAAVAAPRLRAQVQQLWHTGSVAPLACGIFLDQGLNLCPLRWQVDP